MTALVIIFVSITLLAVMAVAVRRAGTQGYQEGVRDGAEVTRTRQSIAWDDGFNAGRDYVQSGLKHRPRNPFDAAVDTGRSL